ncbi:argonaute PAZ domain-containing protein [Synechococcus sp. R55.2]|uniref:argonaute PAZ domain-containing protein n=1 Tax=Synechococcus sp. R55.2 TaxID=2964496 RepID=UPI0039C4ADAC
MSLLQQKVEATLNHFFVKELTQEELTFYEYSCRPNPLPDLGEEQRALSKICNQLGVMAVRLGNRIITREKVPASKLKTEEWELEELGSKALDCTDPTERQALETFERKKLDWSLRSKYKKTEIERSTGGGLIWWVTGLEGVERIKDSEGVKPLCGDGWEVHRGRELDVVIRQDKKLYLEIDIRYHFYSPWTLHEWLENYPDVSIEIVRNTYRTKNNKYPTWEYRGIISNQSPREVWLAELNTSLADYHVQKYGATPEEVDGSLVVQVVSRERNFRQKAEPILHLSRRLSPVLTLEMLASIEDQRWTGKKVSSLVSEHIRKSLEERLKESKETAKTIIKNVYNISDFQADPLKAEGYIMPRPRLLGFGHRQVQNPARVRYQGCARVGETKFGLLNLDDNKREYPTEVRKCLLEVAKKSGARVEIDFYATRQDLPEGDLAQQRFWQSWADKGIKTVLVVMPLSPNEHKQKIRLQALRAGIATQFMIPGADPYKALNVVLGLLCKAAWQPVLLEPLDHPECSELTIGFDVGTNRELYYGTSAFAVLANGQSLGWELPDIQRGETFSGEAIYQTVSKLVNRFYNKFHRYPRKVLLMRDGLVQRGEFDKTIEELRKEKIAVDIVGVRKSGAGRMGIQEEGRYKDAAIGTIIFNHPEKSFTLVTSQPIKKGSGSIGSARPLRVIHEYGSTLLEVLALQTYHLSQLHPASGFQPCRLPWVLHFADKSSKEFQRIGNSIFSVLQNINREKLIAV